MAGRVETGEIQVGAAVVAAEDRVVARTTPAWLNAPHSRHRNLRTAVARRRQEALMAIQADRGRRRAPSPPRCPARMQTRRPRQRKMVTALLRTVLIAEVEACAVTMDL